MLHETLDFSPWGSSVHGIFQVRILERVALFFSTGSFQARNWTRIFRVSCIAGRFFTCWAIREALVSYWRVLVCSYFSVYFHFIYCILFISLALTASFVFSSEASSLYPSFPDKIPTVFTYLPCILLSILWLMLWILYVVNCVILFHHALFSGVFCWAFIWDQFLSLLILLNFLCLSEFR